MSRPKPGRLRPSRPSSAPGADELDEVPERWIIDDLEPLRHEERRIR